MGYKTGDVVIADFCTQAPATGAATDADSLPTGKLVINGTDNAAAVTVTNKATGNYQAAVTLPAIASGDTLQIRIAATVGGVAGKGIVWAGVGDTKRLSDLQDAAAPDNAGIAGIKAKTDNLPPDPADASDVAASFAAVNGTLTTIAGYIDTEVGAIKAKTDNLPASPAAVGSAMTLAAGALSTAAIADGAITDAKITLPADGTGQATGILSMIRWLYARFFRRTVYDKNAGTIKTYQADGTTVRTTQAVVSDGTHDDVGAAT
jgi:hypothetical protein